MIRIHFHVRVLAAAAVGLIAASAGPAAAQARDSIRIVGSSTVYPFATTVAERFGRTGRFKTPVVESTGTGGGFKVFCSGAGVDTPDINDASRPMTDSERQDCAHAGVTSVDELRVGYDGIIVGAVARMKPFDFTLEQLWRATAQTVPVGGKWVTNPYRSWNEIDPRLPNLPIKLYGPAPNHGTRDAFVELVLEPSCRKAPELASVPEGDRKKVCQAVREDGRWTDVSEDYALVLGKLKADPQSLAIFTFSYLDNNRDQVRGMTVGNVAASLETISSGLYPLSRPLFIYVKRQHVGAVPGLAEYVHEFLSTAAAGPDGYLADRGLIPMPSAELKQQQARAALLAAAH